jgi:hypothetical protein
MSYIAALNRFRWTLMQDFMGPAQMEATQAAVYGLHSLKKTLLAFGAQADLPVGHRASQGHHREHGGRASVRVYSADDVWGAILLQTRLVTMVADEEFRPLRAQLRGSTRPLSEPEVRVAPVGGTNWRALVSDPVAIPWDTTIVQESMGIMDASGGVQPSNEEPPLPLRDSDSDRDSSASEEDGGPSASGAVSKYILCYLYGIVHLARVIPVEETRKDASRVIEMNGVNWEAACRCKLTAPKSTYLLSEEPPCGMDLCGRKACGF